MRVNIPEEELETWKKLRSHGDGQEIMKGSPEIKANDITRAFKLGKCGENVYRALSDFYKKKESFIKNGE